MKPQLVTVVASLSFAAGCFLATCQASSLHYDHTVAVLLRCLRATWTALTLLSCLSWLILDLGGKRRSKWVVAALPTIGMVYTIMHLPFSSTNDLARHVKKGYIECICTVESRANSSSYVCLPSTLLYPSKDRLEGQTLLIVTGATNSQLVPGERVSIFGRISRIPLATARWQFDPNRRLAAKGIVTAIRAYSTDIKVLGSKSAPPQRALEKARHDIIDNHIRILGKEKGELLSAMVLGDRVVHLSKEIKERFRAVGLSHLLAASGLNLSIVVAASYMITRAAGLPEIIRIVMAASSTILFVFLAGPSPSVLRAAILCGLFLAARLFSRRLHSTAALSVTLWLALLASPLSVSDVGLQLSYAATGSIIIGIRRVFRRSNDSLAQKINNWLRDTISVIVLAQLAVLPLQLLYFQNVGLLFLPANLMVDPVVAPITLLAFASSIATLLLALIPAISGAGNWLCASIDCLTSWPLDYMLWSAATLSSVKGAMLHLPPPLAAATPTYYLGLLFYFYLSRLKSLRMLGFVVLVGALSILFFRPTIPGQITFISTKSLMTLGPHHSLRTANDEELGWLPHQFLAYLGEEADEHSRMPLLSELVLPATDSYKRRAKRQRQKRQSPEHAVDTAHSTNSESVIVQALDAGDLVIVTRRQSNLLVSLSNSQVNRLEALIADLEIKLDDTSSARSPTLIFLDELKRTGKPIVIWANARKSTVIKSPWLEKTYIAYAGYNSALVLAYTAARGVDLAPDAVATSSTATASRYGKVGQTDRPGAEINALLPALRSAGSIARSVVGLPRNQILYYPFSVHRRIGNVLVLN